MYSTAQTLSLPSLSTDQQQHLLEAPILMSLYEAFAAVPDPRSKHGQRYDLPYLLTCLVAALLCNCNSLEAVGQWCGDHQLLLRRLFGPRDFYTPTGSLYRRLLPRLSAGHMELVLATWVKASRPSDDEEAVALDGKTVRGAATAKHKGPHLLSFFTHQSQETLLQVRVPAKTNEIPIAKMLLPCLRLHPRVYTADALHTHAPFMEVVRDCSGSSVLTVKANQPTLYADLATYFSDPQTVIAPFERDCTVDRRRGRIETRTIEVSAGMNTYLAPTWPLVRQVARLTRTVTVRKTGKTTHEVVYLYRSLCHPGQPSSPARSGAGALEHRERLALREGCLLRRRPLPLAHWLGSSDSGCPAQFSHHPHSSQWLFSDCRYTTPLRFSSL